MSINKESFLTLLKSGLWEKGARLAQFKGQDYAAVMRMSEEQSVVGLVTAGLAQVEDVKIPQTVLLQFVGATLQIEKRNKAMNEFVARMLEKLRNEDIYAILVKGQGIAQCYEKPLWRSSGDIDLLLSSEMYRKATLYFDKNSDYYKEGSIKDCFNSHREYHINDWMVELHGTLNTNLSYRIDKVVDTVKNNVVQDGEIRIWQNGDTTVYLPSPNNDVIFIFVHILQHFFDGGVGLRQICDWCRLLWTYRDSIDYVLLKTRLQKMRLMTEWRAFGALAVNWLDFPKEAMPFYVKGYESRSKRILTYVLDSGNFGHNRDFSYTTKHSVIIRKSITFWRQAKDSFRLAMIFPIDAPLFLFRFLINGLKSFQKKVKDDNCIVEGGLKRS